MELVKVFDEMYNPITMYKSNVNRIESQRKINREKRKKNKKT